MIKPSRRELILRMGAWPLLWPLLQQGRAQADGATPKRVLILFSPNGPIMEKGPAVGTETNFNVHEWWGPVARHKSDGLFFSGMMQAGVPFGKHNEYGHQSAGTGALTARTTEGTNNGTGPSLDQFIGQELQRRGIVTPKRSLLWGLHGSTDHWGPWYEAAGKPVHPTSDPYKALTDIAPSLKGTSGGVTAPDRQLVRKHFVLDNIYKDCREMSVVAGTEGKALLDFHCNNIESLEKSVAKSLQVSSQTMGPACTAPTKPNTTVPSTGNFEQAEVRDEMIQAFVDMMALAFTCDVTRVMGFSFGGTSARFMLPAKYMIPGAAKVDSGDSGPQHHAWTHTYNNGPEKRAALKGFYLWYAEVVARFIDKLKTTPDATGKPLMDSTLVLWTSELGHHPGGNSLEPHPNDNIPVLLFGNGGGVFKTNRLYQGDASMNAALALHQLFVSIIQHAGLTDVTAFGNKGTGTLEWLRG